MYKRQDTSHARRPGSNQGQFVRRDKFKSNTRDDSKGSTQPPRRKTNFRADGNYSQNKSSSDSKPTSGSQKSEDRKKYEKAKIDPSKI